MHTMCFFPPTLCISLQPLMQIAGKKSDIWLSAHDVLFCLIRNISTAGVAQWLWISNKVPMHFCNLIFLLQAARVQGKKTKTKTDSIRLKFATSVKLLCASVFLTMWWLTNTQLLLILENDLGSLGLPLKCCKMSRPPCVLFRHVI